MRKSFILYADDDAEDHELMETVIMPHPEFKLLSFYNGQDLLNHLKIVDKEDICVVVLDINMPELNGFDTLRLIRAKDELVDLPVLMFTTSNTPAEKHVARLMNAEIITKPYSYNQVAKVKEQIIKRCYEYLHAS